jgi:hypothetical protein
LVEFREWSVKPLTLISLSSSSEKLPFEAVQAVKKEVTRSEIAIAFVHPVK